MGVMVCSMPKCNSIAHGAHDVTGANLCRKCKAAYERAVEHALIIRQGFKFPYKLGGESWEKSS